MFGMARLLALLGCVALATAQTQITYPGERGNNLHTNGTHPQFNPDSIGIDYENGSWAFPYGQQFVYPCGGMPLSQNRSRWPVGGGAISIQPGWGEGHQKAFFYINMGIQENSNQLAPPNMSHVLVPPFAISGPSNYEYPGQFCLPQVPTPVNVTLHPGQNVTLQVIELTQNGAALYNCVDVTLVEPEHMIPVTHQNCFNSTDIAIDLVFTTAALSNDAVSAFKRQSTIHVLVAALVAAMLLL